LIGVATQLRGCRPMATLGLQRMCGFGYNAE
jgi:hypothetical protein